MLWGGEAGAALWHGAGDARSLGQLAARSRGPAPAGPRCDLVMRRALWSLCSNTGPWYQLCTPGLAQCRGRIPRDAHPAAWQGLISCESAPADQPREDRGLLDLWTPSPWGLCPHLQPPAPPQGHAPRSQASRRGARSPGASHPQPSSSLGHVCSAASTHPASGASPPGQG